MGKYAPVIKTAECGSMTRAAQTMGYTQPSLLSITLRTNWGSRFFIGTSEGSP